MNKRRQNRVGVEPSRTRAVPRKSAWTPSPRLTAGLAAAMLGVGAAVGAAIGPAPQESLAGEAALPALVRAIAAQDAARAASATLAATPPAVTAAKPARRRRRLRHASGAAETAASETTAPPSTTHKRKQAATGKPLAAVSKVWLIELDGSSFEEAAAAPASAPYIDGEALASGTLEPGWSSLQASAFASTAALLATSEPSLVETIVEPPCPEGAGAAACAPGTPAGITVADAFLKQAVATIAASPQYRTSGLIVITFAPIAPGAASELPAGSTAVTLASRPPAGALLISPFVARAKRASTTFEAAAPRRSMEALLPR